MSHQNTDLFAYEISWIYRYVCPQNLFEINSLSGNHACKGGWMSANFKVLNRNKEVPTHSSEIHRAVFWRQLGFLAEKWQTTERNEPTNRHAWSQYLLGGGILLPVCLTEVTGILIRPYSRVVFTSCSISIALSFLPVYPPIPLTPSLFHFSHSLGPSRNAVMGLENRGVQRHPRRRKMRHRNPRGTKIGKLGGTRFKIVATRCHILKLKCT